MLTNILLIGGTGFIGRFLVRTMIDSAQFRIQYTSRDQSQRYYADLSKDPLTWRLPTNVDLAIILAGISNIQQCERKPDIANCTNVEGIRNLTHYLGKRCIPSLYISSSSVFGSIGEVPFEFTPVCPNTVYGYTKAEAERIVLSHPENCVMRVTKILSSSPLLQDWKSKLVAGHSIFPFEDMYLAPIHISLLGDRICQWISAPFAGICHVSASKKISYYQLAILLCEFLAVPPSLVIPGSARMDSQPPLFYNSQCAYLGCSRVESLEVNISQSLELILSDLD
jgi:dTDP-4-dehydrorhamnose reductase